MKEIEVENWELGIYRLREGGANLVIKNGPFYLGRKKYGKERGKNGKSVLAGK